MTPTFIVALLALASLTQDAAPTPAGGPASQPAASQPFGLTQEQKLVQELYGAELAKARLSRDPDDDIAAANRLITASKDSSNPELFRFALAMEAFKTLLPLGSDASGRAAGEAIAAMDAAKPLPAAQRLGYERDVAASRLARSANDRTLAPPAREALARAAITAQVAYADELDKTAPKEAGSELVKAQQMANRLGIADLRDSLAEKVKLHAIEASRREEIAQALRLLKQAEEAKNADTAKAVANRLGLLQLQFNADIPAAAVYFAKGQGPVAEGVVAAAAFIESPSKLPADQLLPAAEKIALLAAELKDDSQKKVASAGVKMADAFLAGNPTGAEAVRGKAVKARLEVLAEETENDKFVAALRQAYGGLNAKITVLDLKTRRIRAEYHFADRKEPWDFTLANQADWGITPNGMFAPQAPGAPQAVSKLIFDGSKPLTVSLRVVGPQDLEAILLPSDTLPVAGRGVPYVIGIGMGGNTYGQISGPAAPGGAPPAPGPRGRAPGGPGPAGQPFRNPQVRAAPGAVFAETIAWSGRGGIDWIVNGRPAGNWMGPAVQGSLYLRLALRAAATPAAFDDIVLEGIVAPSPDGSTP